MKLLLSFMLMPQGQCSTQERLCLWYRRMTHRRDSGSCPLSSLPEPQTPDFPHAALVCPTFPLQKPWVSGYSQNFVCWTFKSVPVSLVDSHLFLVNRNPTAFHSMMLHWHLVLALVLWAGELSLGFGLHSSQKKPLTAEISLQNLSHHTQE